MVETALAGIDDAAVLYREQPVSVADLWRRIIRDSVETRCDSVTVVVPSWWPPHRVARVADAAAAVTADVRVRTRSALIAADDPATVIEIADDVVAICPATGPPEVLPRSTESIDVARSVEKILSTRILIDAPTGVSGVQEYACAIRAALRAREVDAQLAGIPDITEPPVEPAVRTVARRRYAPVLAAASVALTVCAIGVTAARPRAAAPVLDSVSVAEGRIAFRIPPGWAVARITAGPGSRRIQATSPSGPDVALHVAQSYSPGETLDRTAQVLHQAVDEQPRGIFVDFTPADRRAGRPAVTYREVRVGREIRWTVVLDGATRISIGCQSAIGRADTVAEPCDGAIESAHELSGTEGPS